MFFLFDPVFCLFPQCGAWSQANCNPKSFFTIRSQRHLLITKEYKASKAGWMVESSVSSINRSLPSWDRGIQFDLLYPSWSADDLVILSSNRPRSLRGIKKTVNGVAWSPKPAPFKGIQIWNPGNFSSCLIWNLENFDGGIRDPRLWNPESTAWNPDPRLFCILLNGATRRCSHP